MNWRFLENVLSGVNKYSTVVGRVWLSVLFVFRILVFVAAAEQVWKDEFKDFVCNTQQPGCEQVCFDGFFPISQVRLWALQLIMVSTPSLLVALHVAYREHREQRHQRRLYRDKGSIDGGLLLTYIASLLLKTACEVATLLAFHLLYSGFKVPRLLRCDQSPCPNTVDCYIARATEKTLFLYIMAATSGLCIALNLLEMAYIFCKQCWKCFSRRYVSVEGGACRSSKLSLRPPPGQPPSLSSGVKCQPPPSSGVEDQPPPDSWIKGQPPHSSGVEDQLPPDSLIKGQPPYGSVVKGQPPHSSGIEVQPLLLSSGDKSQLLPGSRDEGQTGTESLASPGGA